mgnify:FL=1
MKVKKLNVYNSKINQAVNNEYPTPTNSFKQPALHLIIGQRTAGKSYLTSLMLAQAQKDKTFDKVYFIGPSFNSNRSYFEPYITPDAIYEPTKDSIDRVIKRVEEDKEDWEKFVVEKELYSKYLDDIKKDTGRIEDTRLMDYYTLKFFEGYVPTWKYEFEVPPRSLLICDDVLGSRALCQSSGLTKCATLNRHIAPLDDNYSNRSACGLGVWILCQTYKMREGIGRALRENVSLLTLFKNKQQKQLDAIKEELANVVDEEIFDLVYNYAIQEKFDNLTIDFAPKTDEFRFRKNLNTLLIVDDKKEITEKQTN